MKEKHWFWFAIAWCVGVFLFDVWYSSLIYANTLWLALSLGMLALRHLVYHIRLYKNLSVDNFWSIDHPRHLLCVATLDVIIALVLRKLGNVQSMLALYSCIVLSVVIATITLTIRRQSPAQ